MPDPRRTIPLVTLPLAVVLLLSTVLGGCAEDVTAVSGTARAFTLYGVLSPQLDTQWVLVYDIEERLALTSGEPSTAVVTSAAAELGDARVWRDSLVQDRAGGFAHVFWSPFQAVYGERYLLTARAADGTETRAEVTVPPRTEIVPLEPRITYGTSVWPVLVEGAAPRLNDVEITYRIDYKPLGQEPRRDVSVTLDYDGAQHLSDNGWVIPIDLKNDFRVLQDSMVKVHKRVIDSGFGVVLVSLEVDLIVANEEWAPPGGVFDPEVLIQPELMTNVEDGFGFIGAGYRLSFAGLPAPAAMDAAGFEGRPE